ncbi:hypothetical protein [Allochromatium vinosum]|uniref:Uncharacterized protein n=1 Tax=Allochromatium vinosum (strain ATCC 17899 / DSM 180 / NBRC 103801 / NCIMB 10441 / D) TaxID=572477 RepID=D3RMJ9_ALLVD|nr:hypothetical protein [Allochromatium vinosum]ADC61257.1 hypothetical protein Alvin_0294 [Allochromatium vinosum DSM 180]
MPNDLDSAERLAIPDFMEDRQSDALERREARIRLAKLEADIAYFQARLELIGEPNSSHRAAQRKLFHLLHKATAKQILDTRRRHTELR